MIGTLRYCPIDISSSFVDEATQRILSLEKGKVKEVRDNLAGIKIGIPKEYFGKISPIQRLKFSSHAMRRGLKLPSFLSDARIVELEVEGNDVSKIVARMSYSIHDDLVLVIIPKESFVVLKKLFHLFVFGSRSIKRLLVK